MMVDLPLDTELIDYITNTPFDLLDDGSFNNLALRIFQHQFDGCEAYRKFCAARNLKPECVQHWMNIPAVPTEAFKEAYIATFPMSEATHKFTTSGTSSGGTRPGNVYRNKAAYRLCVKAWLRSAKESLLPDRESIRILSLAPTPTLAPSASVAYCLAEIMRAYGAEGTASFLSLAGIDFDGLHTALERSVAEGVPILIFGASYSFVYFFDWCSQHGRKYKLADGSRINHGSGYKGRSRTLNGREFQQIATAILGIDESRIVNVLGATELSSQMYDNVLRNSYLLGRFEVRLKSNNPWTRTIVLDAATNNCLQSGEPGILVHFDLAQRANAVAVRTADLGIRVGTGFEILGRAPGTEPRGCGLALEELLTDKGGFDCSGTYDSISNAYGDPNVDIT